ncbi:hypothetical protein BMMON2_12750 [Burkholderia mallei]
MVQIVVIAGAAALAFALPLMLYAASRPGTRRVEHRARIEAGAARIFPARRTCAASTRAIRANARPRRCAARTAR